MDVFFALPDDLSLCNVSGVFKRGTIGNEVRITGNWPVPCGFWKMNVGPLENQQGFLTVEHLRCLPTLELLSFETRLFVLGISCNLRNFIILTSWKSSLSVQLWFNTTRKAFQGTESDSPLLCWSTAGEENRRMRMCFDQWKLRLLELFLSPEILLPVNNRSSSHVSRSLPQHSHRVMCLVCHS